MGQAGLKQIKQQSFGSMSTINGDTSALQNLVGKMVGPWLRSSYSFFGKLAFDTTGVSSQMFPIPTQSRQTELSKARPNSLSKLLLIFDPHDIEVHKKRNGTAPAFEATVNYIHAIRP